MFERQLVPFPVAYPSEASLVAGWEGKKHGSTKGRRRSIGVAEHSYGPLK